MFALTITPISTLMPISSQQNVTVYWSETSEVRFEWRRKRDYALIKNASIALTVLVGGHVINMTNPAFVIKEYDNYYTLHANSSSLADNMLYELIIQFSKPFYTNGSCSIHINVKSIPMNIYVSTSNASILWGTDFNISLVVTDARNGQGISGLTIFADITPQVYNNSIDIVEVKGRNYTLAIKGGLLEADKDYIINLIFKKQHYVSITKRLFLHISKIRVRMEIEATQYVEKSISPINYGDALTILRLRVFEEKTRVPVNISSFLEIYVAGKNFKIKVNDVYEVVPGFFEARISWRETSPGEYFIIIRIPAFIRNNYIGNWTEIIEVNAYLDCQRITPSAEQYVSFRVSVDFMTGSEKIFGIYIPKVYFWLGNGIVIFAIAYGIFKFIAWLKLPWEIKEVNKIIKKVRKGVYEYTVPTRRDLIADFLAEKLGIKRAPS